MYSKYEKMDRKQQNYSIPYQPVSNPHQFHPEMNLDYIAFYIFVYKGLVEDI